MDLLTFLSNIIDSLAWPGVIITTLWIFRQPLSQLIDAIRNAKFKYEKGGISIEGELNTVREKAPSIVEQEPPEDIRNLAISSPVKAIDKSWHDLEASATTAASISTSVPPIKIADTLIDQKILTQSEAEAFYKMYEIQEAATKPCSKVITDASSASAYSGIAHGLTAKIMGVGHVKAESATIKGSGVVTPRDDKKKNNDKP